MEILSDLVQLLPNEAVILVSLSGDFMEMSPGARRFCNLFGKDVISNNARNCSGESTLEVTYLNYPPESHKVALCRSSVKLRVTCHSLSEVRLVVMDRILNYEDLLEQFETVLFMCENIPRGIALHVLDPVSGRNWYRFPNKLYAELSGCTVETLEAQGVMAVGNLVPPEDNRRSSETILNAARTFGDCTITPRIYREGTYKYTRFYGRARPGENGVIENCVVAEDFTEQAQDMNRVNIYKCANYMLSSFARAVFDVCFYTDSKFRIIDDNPKLRYFFAVDTSTTLMYTPLEAFMRLDEDKQRFRSYVAQRLEVQAKSDPEELPLQPAASMIPLRLALVGDSLCSVQLYATPTYLHGMEGFGSSRGSEEVAGPHQPRIVLNSESLQRGCMYLVGIRVVESHPREVPASVCDPPLQSHNESRKKPPLVATKTFALPHVPEDDFCDQSVSSSASVVASYDEPSHGFSRKQIYVAMLVRCIMRDINLSFARLLRLEEVKIGNGTNRNCMNWIIPLYDLSDRSVVQEEVLMSLPQNLQQAFLASSRAFDFIQCSQFLGHSVDGNVDLLRQSLSGLRLTRNIDAIHNAFRYFLGLLRDLDGADGIKLLQLLAKNLAQIEESIPSRTARGILTYEYTLVLLSHAIQHAAYFTSESALGWLRIFFRNALRESESNLFDKSRISPVMYFMCFLWGGLMILIGRKNEAVAVWDNLLHDMVEYEARHPCICSVKKLEALVCYNMGLSFVAEDHLEEGLSFIHQLRDVVVHMNVAEVPPEYQNLIQWAENFQSIVQG